MTKLIIARHGNTFGPNDIPTRVGARTDLPLVKSGINQAISIGNYFKINSIMPDVVYSSELQRTKQTAEYAVPGIKIQELNIFNEIDYGPDENKTEKEVINRIGEDVIKQWDSNAVVPSGWKIEPAAIIQNWVDFANMIKEKHLNKTVFVVTSNGIARFAPYITGDFANFCQNHSIKLKTGALCFLKQIDNEWLVEQWNLRP